MSLDYRRIAQGLILETNAVTPTVTGSVAFDGTNLVIKPSGVMQTVVTDTNSITFQNKTISGANNTLSNISYTSLSSMTSANLASIISDETGTGKLVFDTSPSFTTPSLGAATATTINSTTIPTSKTLVVTTDKLSVMSATTSAELAGVISDETGTGSLVFANTPTLVTPVLGAATGTSLALGGSLGGSALLDVQSTSKGFLEPRMTQAQRDAISTPAAGLQVYNTDTNKLNYYNGSAWAEVGSGSAGGINYIIDYDGSAIGAWVTYADAAGTSPVDGTGGSPNVTYATSSSSAMRGTSNFLFTHAASNEQGQGFSYVMAIDPADRGKVIQLSFNYLVASGTYADNDLSVWFYDVTNSALIQPAPYQIKNTGVIEKFFAEVQVPSSCASLRVIVHVSSATATAYTMRFDDWNCGPQAKLYGSPVTDWVSYTPTLGAGFGTPTNIEFIGARIGDSRVIKGHLTTGTTTTGVGTLNLGPGLTPDSTKMGTKIKVVGRWELDSTANGGIKTGPVMWYPSDNSISLQLDDKTNVNSPFTPAGASSIFGNSVNVTLWTEPIPITGWQSQTIMSSDANTAVEAVAIYSAANTVTNLAPNGSFVKVTYGAASSQTSDAWNGTDTYTAKTPGYYDIKGSVNLNTTNVLTNRYFASVFKNGSEIYRGAEVYASANQYTGLPFATIVKLNAGDTIQIYLFGAGNNSVNQLANDVMGLAISKISGPSQIAASENISALYTGSPPTGTLTSAFNIVTYGTKVKDSHNAYSGGVYTVPAPGTYSISAGINNTGTYALNNAAIVAIFIDGTEAYRKAQTAYSATSNGLNPLVTVHSIPLLAGQLITIRAFNNGTSPAWASSNENWFSITKTGNY